LQKPLVGSVPVPSDKSISHRAILFAGIASGTSRIRGSTFGEDNLATLGAFRAMGIRADETDDGLLVEGRGLFGLSAPTGADRLRQLGHDHAPARGGARGAAISGAARGRCVALAPPDGARRAPLRLRGARIEGRARSAKKRAKSRRLW
jgi:hypothetical protein